MSVQGFHSEDSEDDNSDDEHDHVEGMSGDEQMQEQEDFEGSDEFDQACCSVVHTLTDYDTS